MLVNRRCFPDEVIVKGIVFKKKKLLLIIYSPPCHPRCRRLSFFSRKEIKVFDENIPGFFFPIMHFTGNQMVRGPKDTFSANCKLFKGRFQTMNKGLINRNDRSLKKSLLLALLCSMMCVRDSPVQTHQNERFFPLSFGSFNERNERIDSEKIVHFALKVSFGP